MNNPKALLNKTVRIMIIFFLSCFGLVISPDIASAILLLGPTDDAYIDINEAGNPHDGNGLNLGYSVFLGFVSTQESYFRYDLSGVTNQTGRSTLNFTITNNAWEPGSSVTVALYSVTNDSWNETSLTYNNAPLGISLLESKVIAAGTTGLITFGSTTSNNAVGTYIENERTGDGFASFLVRITGVTGGAFAGGSVIEDRENSQTPAITGDAPYLDMRNPTTITLSAFSASGHSMNPWMLFIGIGAIAGFLIIMMITRRLKPTPHS